MLVKFVNSKKQKWSSFLDTCALRVIEIHMMFGRRATLPIDLETSRTTPEEKAEKYVRAEEGDPDE